MFVLGNLWEHLEGLGHLARPVAGQEELSIEYLLTKENSSYAY